MPRVADLRLLPAALAAWGAAALAVGATEAGPVRTAALAAWGVCAGIALLLVLAARRGRAASALTAALLVAAGAALALTAVGASLDRRSPEPLVAATSSSRALDLELSVEGTPGAGHLDATIVAVVAPEGRIALNAPAVVIARGEDPRPIGSVLGLRARVARADPGERAAWLVLPEGEAETVSSPTGALATAEALRAGLRRATADLPDPGGGLLPGLAVGDTSRVAPALDADMKTVSLSHLTAVSGANCAVVVVLVFGLLRLAGAPRRLRIAGALVALVGFVILVTPEPSVLRAGVMAGVALVGLASGRPGRGIPLLAVSVIALVVVDPWLAREYGFVLSVLATGGLLLLAGPLADRLARWMPRPLALALAVPVAAQLACQPVLLLLDPALPAYGIPANMLAEPAAPVATVLGLAAVLVLPVLPPLGHALVALAWLPAQWIAGVAGFFAGLPGARGPWPTGGVGVALLVILTVLLLVALLAVGRARRAAAALVVLALGGYAASIAGVHLVTALGRPTDWQYAECDVGQGDATLVRSGGEVALVDTGPEPAALATCLDELGIGRIRLLVLTHYDLDHVGGTDAVLGRVDRALVGPPSDPGDARLADALRAGGARVDQVSRGERGVLGELGWQVVWPPPRGVEPGNTASVVLRIDPAGPCRAGCASALLLGDLGEEEQARLLASGELGSVDVVKVAHHGSADQAAALYERIGATVGLIGVGEGNRYGHPTERLLDLLTATSTAAYRTDLDGLVLVAPADGAGRLRVWTERAPP